MLKKENRLKKTKEIDLVFKKGRSEFCGFLGFKYKKNQKEQNRFAFIIGKKVSKLAVERNRIKRIIKGIVVKEIVKMKTGNDCVFIVLPSIKEKTGQEIEKQILKTFKKLKFYV